MIYFACATESKKVKIGYSRDKHSVERRLVDLQIGCPEQLSLLGIIDGSKDDETKLHSRFKRYHVRGEWFHLEDEVIKFLEDNGITVPDFSYKNWSYRATKRKYAYQKYEIERLEREVDNLRKYIAEYKLSTNDILVGKIETLQTELERTETELYIIRHYLEMFVEGIKILCNVPLGYNYTHGSYQFKNSTNQRLMADAEYFSDVLYNVRTLLKYYKIENIHEIIENQKKLFEKFDRVKNTKIRRLQLT